MLAAKEKLAASKTDAESNRLELQCAAIDKQIDSAVYELYGLTPARGRARRKRYGWWRGNERPPPTNQIRWFRNSIPLPFSPPGYAVRTGRCTSIVRKMVVGYRSPPGREGIKGWAETGTIYE
jgi:hypothetical protein